MPHVVTQACCGDASCVFACPVNCIHPTPDEPGFGTAEMLYIDADSCVDCGACVGACPVGAIVPDTALTADQLPFVDINALFPSRRDAVPVQASVPSIVRKDSDRGDLRVAIVGSGPAALYAADELLKQPGVQVTVFEKLPTPHGLVRAGVAPDHRATKTIERLFRQIEDQPGFGYVLGVEVGVDISHDELMAHHHAVLYASGAAHDRSLGIPGEKLPGSSTATDLVAWYNGHPDHVHRTFDLSHERVVVVGNGNVALDVARILATDPEQLATTDIADHALDVLRGSAVREIVLLGRRGAAQAAYTLPELTGLLLRDDIEVVVDDVDLADDLAESTDDAGVRRKIDAVRALPPISAPSARRRIILRYQTSPVEIVGTDHVTGVRVVRNDLALEGGAVRAVPTDQAEVIQAGLVLRSIGYRGTPIADMPFDEIAGVIPHDGGRVRPGAYVAGWIKRGPAGFIGTNKSCSQETVNHLLTDFNTGLLVAPTGSAAQLGALLRERQPSAIDLAGWRAIDALERRRGAEQGRSRSKLTDRHEMLEAARPAWRPRHRIGRRRQRPLSS